MDHSIQSPQRWSFLSQQPKLLATSELSGWRGLEFQEIATPETGTFDTRDGRQSAVLSIFQTCGPMKVRYGSSRKVFSDLLPVPKLVLPNEGTTGAWLGAQRGLHLFIDVPAFELLIHRPFRRDAFVTLDGPNPSITHLLRALHIDVKHGHRDGPLLGETITAALLHQLLAAEAAAPGSGSRGRFSERELARVRAWVDGNLAQPLSVESLATEVGLSVRHLCRLFQATMGYSPYRYVLERRVDRARGLIREGRLALPEIAVAVGFANQSHMATIFRRILNANPSQFSNAVKKSRRPRPGVGAIRTNGRI